MPQATATNQTKSSSDRLFDLVVDLENKRSSLMTAGDADKLAEILSDDLYYAHSSGTHEGKREYVEKYRSGVFEYHSFETEVKAVVPLGNDAIQVNGVVRLEASISGVLKRMTSVYLVVWRRENRGWLLVGHQTTLMPQS